MASDSSSAASSSFAPIGNAAMANESANIPFFLPANENPDLIFTSQPLIGPENYMTWARSVFLALSSKNKFGYVNARDLWIDLKNRLSQDNNPRLFKLQKEISHLVQGSLSVSSYFTKFKTLWDEFMNNQPFTVCNCACVCGSKSSQLDAQHKEHVCSLVLQEENRRNIGNTVNVVQQLDPIAMYVNGSKSFQGNQGNARNNGGKGGNFKKERPVCTYCNFTGHIADKCYKLHEYPSGYKPKGGNKAMANQITGSFGFDGLPNVQPCDAN
nr:uncharacterized protein LOC112006088 [Quercus suber]